MYTIILAKAHRYNILRNTIMQNTIIIIIINSTCWETINPARLHAHIGVRSILVEKKISRHPLTPTRSHIDVVIGAIIYIILYIRVRFRINRSE